MGSGKGKARRAQAPSAFAGEEPDGKRHYADGRASGRINRESGWWLNGQRVAHSVVFHGREWEDFVRGSGLLGVKVAEYYFEENDVGHFDTAEYLEFITDLFNDAVSVGAIELPASYKAEDFQFRIVAGDLDSDGSLRSEEHT